MTDHQTLEWLLTKLRNAESLLDYYTKRIGELEAKPAVEAQSPWRVLNVDAEPPVHRALLVRVRDEIDEEDHCLRVATWSTVQRQFHVGPHWLPNDLVIAWMPIPERNR